MLMVVAAAANPQCALSQKKYAGLCKSQKDVKNCNEWKKARLWFCKAENACDESFK